MSGFEDEELAMIMLCSSSADGWVAKQAPAFPLLTRAFTRGISQKGSQAYNAQLECVASIQRNDRNLSRQLATERSVCYDTRVIRPRKPYSVTGA